MKRELKFLDYPEENFFSLVRNKRYKRIGMIPLIIEDKRENFMNKCQSVFITPENYIAASQSFGLILVKENKIIYQNDSSSFKSNKLKEN